MLIGRFCFFLQPWWLAVLLAIFWLFVPPHWSELDASTGRSSVRKKLIACKYLAGKAFLTLEMEGQVHCIVYCLSVIQVFHQYWAQYTYCILESSVPFWTHPVSCSHACCVVSLCVAVLQKGRCTPPWLSPSASWRSDWPQKMRRSRSIWEDRTWPVWSSSDGSESGAVLKYNS